MAIQADTNVAILGFHDTESLKEKDKTKMEYSRRLCFFGSILTLSMVVVQSNGRCLEASLSLCTVDCCTHSQPQPLKSTNSFYKNTKVWHCFDDRSKRSVHLVQQSEKGLVCLPPEWSPQTPLLQHMLPSSSPGQSSSSTFLQSISSRC